MSEHDDQHDDQVRPDSGGVSASGLPEVPGPAGAPPGRPDGPGRVLDAGHDRRLHDQAPTGGDDGEDDADDGEDVGAAPTVVRLGPDRLGRSDMWRLAALVAACVAVVVVVGVLAQVLGSHGRAPEDPSGRRAGTPVRELERVEGSGACGEAMEAFRSFRSAFSSGVEITKEADAARMNELLAGVRSTCAPEVAGRFDAAEVQPWLEFAPAGPGGGGTPSTLPPAPAPETDGTSTTTTVAGPAVVSTLPPLDLPG